MSNLGEALTQEEIQVHNFFSTEYVLFNTALQGLIDDADGDGDGQINYEEFYNMMTGH